MDGKQDAGRAAKRRNQVRDGGGARKASGGASKRVKRNIPSCLGLVRLLGDGDASPTYEPKSPDYSRRITRNHLASSAMRPTRRPSRTTGRRTKNLFAATWLGPRTAPSSQSSDANVHTHRCRSVWCGCNFLGLTALALADHCVLARTY